MKKKITRRSFVKRSGLVGTGALVASKILSKNVFGNQPPSQPDIAVVNGKNYFENTQKAIDILGGMKRFVPENSTVGLLINSDFEIFPTYTNPDVSIAVLKMVFDAGATNIILLQNVKLAYWERSEYFDSYKKIIDKTVNLDFNQFPSEFKEGHYVLADVPGVSLKKAEIVKKFLEVDVVINLPVAKHHASTIYTGAIKNTMGIATRKTNVGMHLDSGIRNEPNYLAQCIVDLNLLRKADLTITDASEILTSNGPMGPGETIKPMKIVAGADMVAVDSYCCDIMGYSMGEVLTVKKGEDAGIGVMDFNKLKIKEV